MILLIAACAANQPVQLTGNEEDEFGIGGTGIIAGNQQGAGIIGQITGYGSIFVNGIEVESGNKTSISINGITVKTHDFEIGEVVEVLSVDTNEHTQAQHINIRHEVIGPVSSYDSDQASATILGQQIQLSAAINTGIELGDTLAVSGFTDPDGLIHATHIRHIIDKQILLRGKIQAKANSLSLNNIPLTASIDNISANDKSVIRGIYKNGVITTTSIRNEHSLPFDKVAKWVIQGYVANYASQWNINSANPADIESNKTVIFEVKQPNSASVSINILSQQKLQKGSGSKSFLQQKSFPGRSSQPGRQSGSGGRSRR